MSCSSAAEARVAWFSLASGAVDICIGCIGSPEPAVVSSSSVSSAECTCSSNVHGDRDVIHAAGCIGGVEAVRVLIIERSVRVALEILLEIRERAAAEPSRLKLWAWYIGRVTTLLFQYIVEEFLAPRDLYSALFQLGKVISLWSFNDVFQDVLG